MSPQETWASTVINTSTQKLAQEGPAGAGVNHSPRDNKGTACVAGLAWFPELRAGPFTQNVTRGTVEGGLSHR